MTVNLIPSAMREVVFATPGPRLPQGAIGAYYANNLITTPRAAIPNSVLTSSPNSNLITMPRRRFSKPEFYATSGTTVTDSAAAGPDGKSYAATLTGSGGWIIGPAPGGGLFPLTAGTYTLGINVRWRGTGSTDFKLGHYPDQLLTKTASASWQRFTAPIVVASDGNFFPVMLTPDSVSSANFEIDFFELWPGSSDLGPAPLASHLYLNKNGTNVPGVNLVGSLLDCTTGKTTGTIQFPDAIDMSSYTVAMVGKRITNDTNWTVFLGNSTLTTSWSVGVEPRIGNYAAQSTQKGSYCFDRAGNALAVQVHSAGGGTVQSTINIASKVTNSGTVTFSVDDLNFGMLGGLAPGNNPYDFGSGYEIQSLVIWNRNLSDAEKEQAAVFLAWQATNAGNTLTLATRTVLFLGDSIQMGFLATSENGWAYIAALNASPRWHGVNLGVAGYTIADLNTNLTDTLARIAKVVKYGGTPICHIHIGSNDLVTGVSPATLTSTLFTYCDTLRAAGAKIVLNTVLPRTAGALTINDTDRATVNAAILGSVGVHCNAVSDVASDATIGVNGASNNATYYPDNTHLSNAGYAAGAPYVYNAINSI